MKYSLTAFCYISGLEIIPGCVQLHWALTVVIACTAIQKILNLDGIKNTINHHRIKRGNYNSSTKWKCLTLGINGGFNVCLQRPSQLKPSNHLINSRASSHKSMFPSLSVCLQCNQSAFLHVLLNVLGPISPAAQPVWGITPWWLNTNKNTLERWINNQCLADWCQWKHSVDVLL